MRSGVAVGLALLLLTPNSASATCLIQCDGDLIDATTCSVLGDGAFVGGSVATFTLTCETCCSPPGGPVVCNASEPTPDMLAVSDPASPTPIEATCGPVAAGCEGAWACDVGSASGKYTITANSMVVTWFATASGVPCATNEDCGAPQVCIGGMCTTNPNACETDLDCSFSEICQDGQCVISMTGCMVDLDCSFSEVCEAGLCVPMTTYCMTDLDCSFSEVCMAGVCVPQGDACATDLDCSFSEVCMNGLCVKNSVPCSTDADCPGVCGICLAGSCFGGGDIECEGDGDCGDGETCLLDPDEVCLNQCVPSWADGVDAFDGTDGTDGTGSCVENEDCGSCAVCVGGECKGLGLVTCITDSDCEAGFVCEQHATDQCKNACVPEGTTDGATDATDTTDGTDAMDSDGADATDGETDATDAADGATDAADGATDATDAADGATDATDGATDGATDATDAADGATDATDAADGATDATDGAEPKKASASCGASGDGAPQSFALLLAAVALLVFGRLRRQS
ncbi:MAG: hypothetical protein IV100_19595 [Myxococcales bacterium]|nr:hypothetical protein [Myxococcales bacterium]